MLSTVQTTSFHFPVVVEHRQFLSYHTRGMMYQFSSSVWICCNIQGVHKVCASFLSAPAVQGFFGFFFLYSCWWQPKAELLTSHVQALGQSQEETEQSYVPDLCSMCTILMEVRIVSIMDTVAKFLHLTGIVKATDPVVKLRSLHIEPFQCWFNSGHLCQPYYKDMSL